MHETPAPLWRRLLPAAVLLLALGLGFFLFTGIIGAKADAEALRAARRSLHRAAVECYAIEGAYPHSADYLARHYGVALDENRFIVHYVYVASNLMPDITVLPVKAGDGA